MPIFSGKYYYSLDEKGRVMIPSPLRDTLKRNYSSKLYVTNSTDRKCIQVYPAEEWQSMVEKVRQMPQSKKSVRWFMRTVIASAHECELDRQGRLLVPSALREDAGLDGEVVVVGQINKIEIWSRQRWDEETDPNKVDIDAFEEELASYGL